METTRLYRDNIGIILGLYRNNGKEHGNCYSILWVYIGVYIRIMEKKM